MSRLAIIDGDIIVHRCAVVFDDPIGQMSNGCYRFDIESAKRNVGIAVERILKDTKSDRAVFCLSGKENFRKEFNPEYKSNRTKRKPILFLELRDWVVREFDTFERRGLEADDVMGILATTDVIGYAEEEKVICSIDKDLRTIPGLHWNWDKQDGFVDEPDTVKEIDAIRMFYRQGLMGDKTDGYHGCPGIGPVSAAKVVTEEMVDETEMWKAVVACYVKAGFEESDALMNARCARILRAQDFDFEKGEVILWTPQD